MKTKTKILVLAEIAIMLCSVFLVALPAIAAAYGPIYGHTDLDVFGNANEDDTIDMRDTTYIKLVIFSKKPKTNLADANNDGKISMLDVGQTKLIILGKEKKLTFRDCDNKTVTVHKPQNRIVAAYDNTAEVLRILGAKDRVVGVCTMIAQYPTYFPDLAKKPCVGSRSDLDVEKILELEPDAVILASQSPELEEKFKGTDIDVVRLHLANSEIALSEMRILGYILDEEENARVYSEWQNKYLDIINERVSVIPEDEKLTVFVDRWGGTTCGGESAYAIIFEMAGGINIAAELGRYPKVDPEWVVEQNPDVIIGLGSGSEGSYEIDDVSMLKARYDEIIRKPEFEYINAVKNNRVYITHYIILLGPGYHVGVTYLAKWLYPNLFEDLDPQAVHQKFIDIQGIDYDLDYQGAIVYTPLG